MRARCCHGPQCGPVVVASPVTGAAAERDSAHQLESIIKNENTKAHKLITSAAERLCLAGFEASTSVREGDPKSVILDCATLMSFILRGHSSRSFSPHLALPRACFKNRFGLTSGTYV